MSPALVKQINLQQMSSTYETDELLAQYLLLHYGDEEEVMPYAFGPREALGFPMRCIRDTGIRDLLPAGARALEVGCAVGRSSFELARTCAEVVGVDYSATFIAAANHLRSSGFYDYSYPLEGALTMRSVAAVPNDIERGRVRFLQGDAQALPLDIGVFDAVVASNLICRLRYPQRFLVRLPQLLKPGGHLLLTTPYSWLEQYTSPENWLGGTEQTGLGFNGLKAALAADFELLNVSELPFLIREHLRKYQWGVAQASLWQRRG